MKSGNSINRKLISSLFLFLILFASIPSYAQKEFKGKEKLISVANAILKDAVFQFVDSKTGTKYESTLNVPDDAKLKLVSGVNDWRYWNGVLNIAMIRLSETFGDSQYEKFAKRNIEFQFANYGYFQKIYKEGEKGKTPLASHFNMEELDDCGAMGASVIEIQKRYPQDIYRQYIDKAANHISKIQERLEDGTLVRKGPFKYTLWVDDLYMGLSFLTRMGEYTKDKKYLDDAAKQVINFHKYLFDDSKGLMHHCWYSDVKQPGVAYWGRANGWAMVAQVDLLDRLPKNHPKRDQLIKLLQKHIRGLAQYQGEEGLWHQLLDKNDSYLETSCTAMFSYTIARAVNNGYIDKRYGSIALRGWDGVLKKIRDDGLVENVCAGTGVSDELVFYYHRPTPLNDLHGIGAIILAGTEVYKMVNNNK